MSKTKLYAGWAVVTVIFLGGFYWLRNSKTTFAEPAVTSAGRRALDQSKPDLEPPGEDRTRELGSSNQDVIADETTQEVELGNLIAPVYGAEKVDGVTLEEIVRGCDDLSKLMGAESKARSIYKNVVREVVEVMPDIHASAISTEAAVVQSANGGAVLRLADPTDASKSLFVPCPSQYAERVAELRMIATEALNNPVLLRSNISYWRGLLSEEEAAEYGSAAPKIGGVGFDLLDKEGKIIREVHYNIPGFVASNSGL